jgi:cbb3-type cytochrome oxidase subunit 3
MAIRIKLKVLQWGTGFVLIFAWASICYAAASNPSWYEHVDLLTVLFGMAISAIVFFALRTLQKIDKNQERLFELNRELRNDFNLLKGRCDERLRGKG